MPRTLTSIDIVHDIRQKGSNGHNDHVVYLILKKGAYEGAVAKCERLYYVLMCRLPTYAAQMATVVINETRLASAVLQHRIALVPIKQSALTQNDKQRPFRISRKGPGYTYSGQCVEAKFSSDSVCLFYLENDTKRVVMDCHLLKGDAEDHALFNPVSAVQVVKSSKDSVVFKMLSRGQFSTRELGEVIASVYNDDNIQVPPRKTDIMQIKCDDDVNNTVPRSRMALSHGVHEWPTFWGPNSKVPIPTTAEVEALAAHTTVRADVSHVPTSAQPNNIPSPPHTHTRAAGRQ